MHAVGHPSVLNIRGLRYRMGDRVLFSDLDLNLDAGTSAAVMGASGSGKSTLLSTALGLVRPDEGQVQVLGTEITRMSQSKLATLRAASIGMVFQTGELLPDLTSVENVALPLLLGRLAERSVARSRAEQLLADLGVDPRTGVPDLSGGEQQRVAVARALIAEPSLLLADEPTGSLDPSTRDTVADLIFSLPNRYGCAVLVVTHDPQLASRANAVYELADGRLAPAEGERR